jgi:hypothetical protein
MFNPQEIAKEVDELRKTKSLGEAMEEISKKYKIRFEDIKVLCSIYLDNCELLWTPNMRKNEGDEKEYRKE